MPFLTKMKFVFPCLAMMLVSASTFAQKTAIVNGRFRADSISIGLEVPYSLTARYPRNQQVLFPDSTFSFAPFEFSRKKIFPTKTDGFLSYDSAVYYLNTFEIDSIQRLALPVFIVQNRDCVAVVASPDSVALQFRVAHVPDSVSAEKLPLKTNTLYQKVRWLLNYPVMLIIIGIIVVVLIVCWIFFGKRIRRYFELRRLNRQYLEFTNRFTSVVGKLNSGFSNPAAEEAIVIWKKYLETLEKFPFTKFTSKEIRSVFNDRELDQALHAIDRSIYGGYTFTPESFQYLQTHSQMRFKKKEAEVKNG